MVEDNKKNSFQTETGSLKFGGGSFEKINGEECWRVPGLGIYDSSGKYIGETIEDAEQTIEKRKTEASPKE